MQIAAPLTRLALGLSVLALVPALAMAFPKTTELNYKDKGPLVAWANKVLASEIKDVRAGSGYFSVGVAEYDLNRDGTPERIVNLGSTYFGQAGGEGHIYTKRGAKWVEVFAMPCGNISILPTKTKGYADILLAEPGKDIPVYHWNGKTYAFHHNENGFS